MFSQCGIILPLFVVFLYAEILQFYKVKHVNLFLYGISFYVILDSLRLKSLTIWGVFCFSSTC